MKYRGGKQKGKITELFFSLWYELSSY